MDVPGEDGVFARLSLADATARILNVGERLSNLVVVGGLGADERIEPERNGAERESAPMKPRTPTSLRSRAFI